MRLDFQYTGTQHWTHPQYECGALRTNHQQVRVKTELKQAYVPQCTPAPTLQPIATYSYSTAVMIFTI